MASEKIGVVGSPSTSTNFICELNEEGKERGITVTAIVKAYHPRLGKYVFGVVEEVKEVHPEMGISESRVGMYASAYATQSERMAQLMDKVVRARAVTALEVRVIGSLEGDEIERPMTPLPIGSPVYLPSGEEVAELLGTKGEIELGKIPLVDTEVRMDIDEDLPTHVAIFAQTGHGKTYTAGCIVEDLLENGAPVVVIEPTKMEWHTLAKRLEGDGGYSVRFYRLEKDDLWEKDLRRFREEDGGPDIPTEVLKFDIAEDGLDTLSSAISLIASEDVTPAGRRILSEILGIKNTLKERYTLGDIKNEVDYLTRTRDSPVEVQRAARKLLGQLMLLEQTEIYSRGDESPTKIEDIVSLGVLSIINLRGAESRNEVKLAAYLFLKRLVEASKREKIPHMILVLEEAHELAPRGGNDKLTNLIDYIARQGRRIGIGLILVSQKPSKVNETVVSQCSTVILGRLIGSPDLDYIRTVIEGIDPNILEELKSLDAREKLVRTRRIANRLGTPIKITVRERRTLHGGKTPSFVSNWREWRERYREGSAEVS